MLGSRERILTIRLIEKAKANPATAEKLGIFVSSESLGLRQYEPKEKEGA